MGVGRLIPQPAIPPLIVEYSLKKYLAMKPLLLTLLISLLLLTPAALAQGFVEKFRSEPGHRPPAEAWYSYGTAAARIDDLNGNGAPDMPFMLGQTLAIYDGQTRETIWELPNASRFEEIKWYGFFKYYDKGDLHLQATHLVLASVTAGTNPLDIRVFDVSTGEIVWQMQNALLMAVTDLDNDGWPELLVGDRDNRQVVMMGWEDGGATVQPPVTPVTERHAPMGAPYKLTLKYESDPDMELAYDSTLSARHTDLDINGDGIPEIVMVTEDETGDFSGLAVRDGATHDLMWLFPKPASLHCGFQGLACGFHGFYDVNGDGQREALFGQRTVVTLDKTVHTLDEEFEILAVHDLDGDGYPDLVGQGLQNNTVQVWGRDETSTATEDEIEAALAPLLENYPNPFREATTIAYEVHRAGPVTITIYDMLGRRVRTLVEGEQSVGTHQVAWDGTDASGLRVASGTYFYQLRVHEAVTSKQAVRLR